MDLFSTSLLRLTQPALFLRTFSARSLSTWYLPESLFGGFTTWCVLASISLFVWTTDKTLNCTGYDLCHTSVRSYPRYRYRNKEFSLTMVNWEILHLNCFTICGSGIVQSGYHQILSEIRNFKLLSFNIWYVLFVLSSIEYGVIMFC